MRFSRSAGYLSPLALALITFGCSDLPTANDPSAGRTTAGFFDRAPAPGFDALEWAEPVAQGIEVHQQIGPAGGVIQLGRSGVEIHFPEGAVSETVVIEAQAVAGSAVAIVFGGRGLTFNVPVEIRIDRDRLTGPWAKGRSEEVPDGADIRHHLQGLLGVCFAGDPTTGVTPLETIPVYVQGGTVVLEIMGLPAIRNDGFRDLPIHRFVGYAVASG